MDLRKERRERKSEDSGLNTDLLFSTGVFNIDGQLFAEVDSIRFESNVRKKFHDEDHKDLRDSISILRERQMGIGGYGVLHPVTVRPDESAPPGMARFIGIAGNRRFKAIKELEEDRQRAKAGKFSTPYLVPIVVSSQVSDATVKELQLHENEQAVPLSPAESGQAYLEMQRAGMTPQQIANAVGKRLEYVSKRLVIPTAPEDIQEFAAERDDSLSLILELVEIGDKSLRRPLIKLALERDFTDNFKHGIKKLTEQAREVKNEYKADLRRRANASKKKTAVKSAPPAPAVLGSIDKGAITSRSVVLSAPVETVPAVETEPVTERPFADMRAKAHKDLKGAQNRINLEVGTVKAVDDTVSYINGQVFGDAVLDEHEKEEWGKDLKAIRKRAEDMKRSLDALIKTTESIEFKADIKEGRAA